MDDLAAAAAASNSNSNRDDDDDRPWKPKAFSYYSSAAASSTQKTNTSPLHLIVRRPLVVRLTRDIVESYRACNPSFNYSDTLNPKRFLTTPSTGVLNDGFDNANSDLILSVNSLLLNNNGGDSQTRYIVKDLLGHGTFGQVAKCWVSETNSYVAVKIIKNQPAYYQQALVEVSILTTLNKKFDPEDKHHIVRILDYFVFQRHLCISFELLDTNLYELIKMNQFRGLSMSIVQLFSKQILSALILMKDASIIHCDLKPENILLCTSVKPAAIKVIDFGSACMEDRTVYSYIQSRYYRSPEVLLGYQYTTAIDMWSFGCIIAELFLGLPLFPGSSEFDLLRRMLKILGGKPPDHVLKDSKNTSKFFKRVGNIHFFENNEATAGASSYEALTEEEYEARELKKPLIGKEYFNHMKLEEIITSYPPRKNLSDEEIVREQHNRTAMNDFLRGLFHFDPAKRWSPLQASKHPFVTGEPFTCPFKPLAETPRVPVAQNVKVDHHPGGGHWFAAGLSPQVSSMNRGQPHNSPHFQMVPYTHAGSYGSLGSHGSYTDGAGLGSSYGSYGDDNYMYAYYSPVGPSGFNIHPQGGISIHGACADARRRTSQFSHGNGLGISPSTGNLGPMSLGASPSQFTPPNSHIQVSTGSPGKYGPTSPARSTGVHGSPLGKVSGTSQYNKRRNWGYPSAQPHENASSPHRSLHHLDASSCSYPEVNSRVHSSGSPHSAQTTSNVPNVPNWRHQRGGVRLTTGLSSSISQNTPFIALSSTLSYPSASESTCDKSEINSLPDPGDWDPNYSDELLLEEDASSSSDRSYLASEFRNVMHLGHNSNSSFPTTGNASYLTMQTQHSQRTTGGGGPHVKLQHPPPSVDGHPLFVPNFPQNFPSRFGQLPVGQPSGYRNYSNINTTSSWGPRRGGHTIPPMAYTRKD
ncbi:dual-specificity kinase [Ranunculus cassubicifolius]